MDVSKQKVLVVGDLMLDRTWLTSFRASPTSESHANVEPHTRFNPEAIDVRAGGAGMTALSISSHPMDTEVHLLSSDCHSDDVRVFQNLGLWRAETSDCSEENRPPHAVTWHILEWDPSIKPITTVKFRIFDRMAGQTPKLRHRFDQDPPNDSKIEPCLPASLPQDIDIVFLSEFNKGAITENLLMALQERYCKAFWLLEAKNKKLLESFGNNITNKRFVILSNRSEAEQLFTSTLSDPSKKAPQKTTLNGKKTIIWPHLLHHGSKFLTDTGWQGLILVVKLDEDGAVAFWRDSTNQNLHDSPVQDAKVWVCAASGDKFPNVAGIGARDFFSAGCINAIIQRGKVTTTSQLVESLLIGGIDYAQRWIKFSDVEFWESKAHKEKKNGKGLRDCPWPQDLQTYSQSKLKYPILDRRPEAVEAAIRRSQSATKYPKNLGKTGKPKELTLSEAKGYLGEFLTVDPVKGDLISRFADEIKEYFERTVKTRPLNCAIWADPGSGKSFFAKEVAAFAKAHFTEINVSQMTSTQELLNQLGYIAGNKRDRLVLLLDEVETLIQGSHVYPQLLAPLWDGTVASERGLLDLGRRFVCILVASKEGFKTGENFVRQIANEKNAKGPDLASRINGRVMTLQAPSNADRAYMAASLIKRNFGETVSQVHFGLLDFIVKGKLSPRKIEQLLGGVKQPRDGCITKDDWKHLVEDGSTFLARLSTKMTQTEISAYVRNTEIVTIKE